MSLRLRFLPPIIAAALTTLLVSSIQYYAPEIEGRFFPVSYADEATIAVERPDLQSLMIWGTASKYRDCEFTGTEVYVVGDNTTRELARLTVGTSIRLRPVSKDFPWGPWRITIPVYRSNLNIKAITTHRCHPLWPTRTVFWNIDLNSTGNID